MWLAVGREALNHSNVIKFLKAYLVHILSTHVPCSIYHNDKWCPCRPCHLPARNLWYPLIFTSSFIKFKTLLHEGRCLDPVQNSICSVDLHRDSRVINKEAADACHSSSTYSVIDDPADLFCILNSLQVHVVHTVPWMRVLFFSSQLSNFLQLVWIHNRSIFTLTTIVIYMHAFFSHVWHLQYRIIYSCNPNSSTTYFPLCLQTYLC